jgi:hypothetical protein
MRRNGRRARVGLYIADVRHMRMQRKVNRKRDAPQQIRGFLWKHSCWMSGADRENFIIFFLFAMRC